MIVIEVKTRLSDEMEKFTLLARSIVKVNREQMEVKYPSFSGENAIILSRQLTPVLHVTKGHLEGKTFLDLGCGCEKGYDGTGPQEKEMYQPWFCRFLHHLGLDVVGVDVYPSSESFRFYEKDLTRESLDFLEDSSIDVATAFSFFDSPWLNNYSLAAGNIGEFRRDLIERLSRKVKPEGAFVYGL
jgi:hypothetical protein